MTLRAILRIVIALNLAGFALEVLVASAIGSVALFADSVDFIEDASIGILALVAMAWSARASLGMALAGVILAPSLATLAMAWRRFAEGAAPEPLALSATGVCALAVNGVCALLLAPRADGGSLLKAAFLSARNDTLANAAIIVAGLVMAATRGTMLDLAFWPDLVVGLGIGLLNVGAAREVFLAARAERPDERFARD
jgi:Co/Zn/Cd efflux system component